MPDGIKLIVGLGNPGEEYAATRHNVGAWFVQKLSEKINQPLKRENKLLGFAAKAAVEDHPYYLFIPTTYMNESGQAVAAIARFYKIEPKEILVAHDELDFPAGKIRLKENGGHAGHNGLRDIIQHLGTHDFYRLRIGIGHPGHKDRVTPYVLSKPSQSDREHILKSFEECLPWISDLVRGEVQKVMKELHGKTDGI